MTSEGAKDLALLVADKDMEISLDAVLSRPEALSTRPITYSLFRHPFHDGGVRSGGADLLNVAVRDHQCGLLVLDLEGAGASSSDPLKLEALLNGQLEPTWEERAAAIVIAPELDVWMWGSDEALRDPLGWTADTPIRAWLETKRFEFDAAGKPIEPKEAMEAVTKYQKRPRSSKLYGSIVSGISLSKCTDLAFDRFRRRLQTWFPPV